MPSGHTQSTTVQVVQCTMCRRRTMFGWSFARSVAEYSLMALAVFMLLTSQCLALPLTSSGKQDFTFPDARQAEFVSSLKDYEISHPHRLTSEGDFLTHHLPHRVRRSTSFRHAPDNDDVHYHVTVGDKKLRLKVRPNHRLLAPGFVIEHKKYSFGNVSDSVIRHYSDELCHFTGEIVDHPGSSVAIATCNGLHGILRTNQGDYFIEPVKGHNVTDKGHPHLVYKASALPDHILGKSHHHHHRGRNHKGEKAADGEKPEMICGVQDGPNGDKAREEWEKDHHQHDAAKEAGKEHKRRRQRRSLSLERYVETMIVVDDKMYEYYKDDDLENYVLTIMNMVTTMYHDATIGNNINIVLVRLIMGKIQIDKFLEGNELSPNKMKMTDIKLEISYHAEKTLNSFCKWQKELNPPPDHPNHHDVAVLLTRYNICSKRNAPCSTLGLSHVSGMCQPHRTCNVNEDTGLALAYTVAHEIGHNFGMQHDNPGSNCAAGEGRQLIMAPVLNGASPLVWSNCSQAAITKFLDRDWGYCLNNEPKEPDLPFPNRPPGLMYDADHQCKLQYGPSAKHCEGIDNVCKTLWCKVDSKCLTRLEAAAEGTICDTNKWCYAGDCVPITDSSPEAIHGEWGSWGSWTECSRTCGAGVSYAERFCDNPHPSNGGKYCLGERKRFRICNTDPCDDDAPKFRSVQCSEFDTIPYRGKLYQWEPVSTYDNSCQLHCKPKGEFFSVMMKDMVTDGTPCQIGRRDLCISGRCRTVGCDWVIDSDAKEDSCGVCHGDGTTCKTVKSEFKKQNGQGYVEAVVIPKGARNIRVEEVAEANNYLAVANDRGQYYLNGYWFIQWSGDYDAAGTILHYTREGNREKFYAPGPLKEALHIMLLFQSQNPGVEFEYTVPSENATDRRIPEFYWKYLPWTHCTVSCGGGNQRRTVVCVEREAGIVDDFYCNISSKPADMQRDCNNHLCPARWWAGPWQHCSVSCGDNGIHHRTVMCVRSHGRSEQQALDDYECEAQEKPASVEPCHHKEPCPDDSYWEAMQWSDCIGTCGKGFQTRNVTCMGQKMCKPELKPKTRKDCYLDPCPGTPEYEKMEKSGDKQQPYNDYRKDILSNRPVAIIGVDSLKPDPDAERDRAGILDMNGSNDKTEKVSHLKRISDGGNEVDPTNFKWVPMAWEECDSPCGQSVRTRKLMCFELDLLEEVDHSYCEGLDRPTEEESCNREPCLDWSVEEWSTCSVTCGNGVLTRSVTCPEENKCDPRIEPESKKSCYPGDCIAWITGPWNECSKSCGGGEQYRHLQCVNQMTQEPTDGCDPENKPATQRKCHEEPCPDQQEELQEEKTYEQQCAGDRMSRAVCKALKHMGQCQQRYVQIKCCQTCHNVITEKTNKQKLAPTS